MKRIEVTYQPSEWACVWLYPQRPNSLFSQIQVWEWQRVHNEDDYLDLESYVDLRDSIEEDRFQQDET